MGDANPAVGKKAGFSGKDFDAGLLKFTDVIGSFGGDSASEEAAEERGGSMEFEVVSLWPGKRNGEFEGEPAKCLGEEPGRVSLAREDTGDTEALFGGEQSGFEGRFVVSEDGKIVRHG
ncbi:MAG: hypothetical protein RLZZ458_1060 [Planctomycetota bacterium]|jgi:hypothetical protein